MNQTERARLIHQNLARRRAHAIISDCFKLIMITTPIKYRAMVRYLNDSIGMDGYEVISPVVNKMGVVNVEMYVPGRDLALLLKLTFGGATEDSTIS